MRSRRRAWVGVWCLLLEFACGGAPTLGQATTAATEAELHAMARVAGVIFTGEVVAVRRHDAPDGATGVVEVEFALEDAVRGVGAGTYILREWAGLWTGGYKPFREGQRYLMLLYAPGAAGLSSPVGGMDGAIPIHGGDKASPSPAVAHLAGASVQAGTDNPALRQLDIQTATLQTVDLRWIATRVARPVAYRAPSVAQPTALPVSVRFGTASTDAPPAQEPAYTTVMSLLRDWVRDDAAAR